MLSASMCVSGRKRRSCLPASSGFFSCSLMLASKEVLRDLPERGSKGSQPDHPGTEFASGLRCFSTARDDLAELIELAEDAVPLGFGLRQSLFRPPHPSC